MLTRTKLAGIALGAAFLLCGAGPAKADCNSRIRNAERDFSRAESRYGPWSRQANDERNELRRAQESCGYYRNNGSRNGWFRGDGDRDRDDRWVNRNRDRDRDNAWRRRNGDHDRDDHRRDRDRNRDRDHDRDRDRDRH